MVLSIGRNASNLEGYAVLEEASSSSGPSSYEFNITLLEYFWPEPSVTAHFQVFDFIAGYNIVGAHLFLYSTTLVNRWFLFFVPCL